MSLIGEIQGLPESGSPDELASYFRRVMIHADKGEAFNALNELADRQWHTYEALSSNLSAELERWLVENWDRNSLSDAENLTSIVALLGLTSVYSRMKQECSGLPSDIKEEFKSFFDEVGESVADPYSGMR